MYIPKGKLDPTIYYTNGGEYFLSSTKTSYTGYYHKDTLGGVWTGKEHDQNSIILLSSSETLETVPDNINTFNSNSLTYYKTKQKSNNSVITESTIPISDTLPPTQDDYQQTYFTRYILKYKLSSSPLYIEVNKNTYYTVLSSPDSLYYDTVEVLWKIYGPLYDVKKDNILIQGGIIDSNKRSVQEAEKIIKDISNYLNDLTLYARIVG
jgi:hypothetical protein